MQNYLSKVLNIKGDDKGSKANLDAIEPKIISKSLRIKKRCNNLSKTINLKKTFKKDPGRSGCNI